MRFLQANAPRLRTFFTEAKENKYALGKSASDERYCSVEQIFHRRNML
jgi:hypothetical protein